MCGCLTLFEFLDLGYSALADAFLRSPESQETQIFYPLTVLMCRECGLAQLDCVVSADKLYGDQYVYDCSVTAAGRTHWNEFARTVHQKLGLNQQSLVVDVGSNVGFLLECFKGLGARVRGIEPAPRVAEIACSRGIPTKNSFFSVELARNLRAEHGPATVITATNVFAHIDNLHVFMEGVDILLGSRGNLILEFPYLLELVQGLAYDTVYHEHLSYLSIKPLNRFFSSVGYTITDIVPQEIHGGSLRVVVGRRNECTRASSVDEFITREESAGLYNEEKLRIFAENVKTSQDQLVSLLRTLKSRGSSIAAVSAPAKGMTLLNVCKIGTDLIDCISEKSPLKIGARAPGVLTPIVSDQELLRIAPDYCLLLAWNFKDEILKNLAPLRDRGSKFIIPLPYPTILEP